MYIYAYIHMCIYVCIYMHIHVLILPQTPLPFRLPHNTEQSSMCYREGPCWLSILNIVVCTFLSQTPKKSCPPMLPSGNHKLFLEVCDWSFFLSTFVSFQFSSVT